MQCKAFNYVLFSLFEVTVKYDFLNVIELKEVLKFEINLTICKLEQNDVKQIKNI